MGLGQGWLVVQQARRSERASLGPFFNRPSQIKTIPPTIKNLTNLVKLSLIDNLLEELPDEIGRYIEFDLVSSGQ
jgi:Leucine-rich repeat (LRR) protein